MNTRSGVISTVALCISLSGIVQTALLEEYLNFEETKSFLQHIADKYPSISNLYSIGKSVQGRDLLVLEISTTSGSADLGVPNVKIVGNIHGNEPVGKEIILRLAKFLVEEYENGTTSVQKLLNTTRIHLLASGNPDGFELAKASRNHEECSWDTAGRKNAKGVELSRNFPINNRDYLTSQPESESIKRWADQIPFVASLILHSGNIVAIYPYDHLYQSDDGPSSVTPDDDVFRHLSLVYANKHPYMHEGKSCSQHHQSFKNGIMNGGNWYPIKDGMADYNYLRKGCLEITIEMCCCKYPLANQLQRIWTENQSPLISWLQEVHRGIKGIIKAARTGDGIPAILEIDGRPITFYTSQMGEYWRILLPGSYKMKVKSLQPGYNESTVVFTIPDDNVEFMWLNISLVSIYDEVNYDQSTTFDFSSITTTAAYDDPLCVTEQGHEHVETEKYDYVKSSSSSCVICSNNYRYYDYRKNPFVSTLLLFVILQYLL